MFGLLIFGFILVAGLSLISRPFRWRRRYYRSDWNPWYGRGWGFGRPMIFEERREYRHHHHHDGGWGGGHHHHHGR